MPPSSAAPIQPHPEQPRPRSLLLGASGQVGAQMHQLLTATQGSGAVLPAGRRGPVPGWLDLDLAALRTAAQADALLDPHLLGAIFCIAGMTNVDGCEQQPELAYQVNAHAPGVLAAYARRRSLPFVYFSTEYLFAGLPAAPGPYPEDAPPQPLNIYGHSKLRGETAVLDSCPEALVVRTTVVYGPDAQEKNYLYTLMRHLSAGKPLRVPDDQISTPTYNRDLIRAVLGLVESHASGIFHVCGPERLDRLTFAREAATLLGLDRALLHGVSTAELAQRAPRPLAAGLSIRKLTSLFPALRMRTLAESLAECAPELLASTVPA